MEDMEVLEGCGEGEEQPSGKRPRCDLQQGTAGFLGQQWRTKLETSQQEGAGKHRGHSEISGILTGLIGAGEMRCPRKTEEQRGTSQQDPSSQRLVKPQQQQQHKQDEEDWTEGEHA